MKTTEEWIADGLHLPGFLRDFHDQKAMFKWLAQFAQPAETDGCPNVCHVSWVGAQIYVIDTFLRMMAACGWTLQRARRRDTPLDLAAELAKEREKEDAALRAILWRRAE